MKKINYEAVVFGECSPEVQEQLIKCSELEIRVRNGWVVLNDPSNILNSCTYRGLLKEKKLVPWAPHRFIGKMIRVSDEYAYLMVTNIHKNRLIIKTGSSYKAEELMNWEWIDGEGRTGLCRDEVDE